METEKNLLNSPGAPNFGQLWENYLSGIKQISKDEGKISAFLKGVSFFPFYLLLTPITILMDAHEFTQNQPNSKS